MKKVILVMALLVVGLLFWRYRAGRSLGGNDSGKPSGPVSAVVAEHADAKLRSLKEGETTAVALHANELQSLLQFRFLQLLPAFVEAPEIELDDARLELRARVPVEQLPSLNELGEAAAFLPDTTEVGLIGTLLPLDSGRVALVIQQVRAARVPLPQRLVPRALQQLGRKDEPGLPRDAFALPLPPGAAGAYLEGDSLVLLAQPLPRSNP